VAKVWGGEADKLSRSNIRSSRGARMVAGLYAAARGMVVQVHKQNVYANNLANANTTAYKRQRVAQNSFASALAATAGQQEIALTSGGLDMREGPIQKTGNALDVALHGPGFLVLRTPQGPCYSRDGRLRLDANRQLISIDGHPVAGQAGSITLPPGEVTITEEGDILVGGQKVDRLLITEFDTATTVRKFGGNLLQASAPPTPSPNTTVTQGYVEGSNVRVVEEMAAMLKGLRQYEANAAALRQQDSSLQTLIRRAAPM